MTSIPDVTPGLRDSVQYGRLLSAAHFAACKHQAQRRKGIEAAPYINHPLEVAMLLSTVGRVDDPDVLCAALLHDVLEDTDTQPAELARMFGARVLAIVQAVTDDKSLPKTERVRRQIEHAPHMSLAARQVKLADKISNITSLMRDPPVAWPPSRQLEYLDRTEQVVAGLQGCNPALERLFYQRRQSAPAAASPLQPRRPAPDS